ncbi:MAG: putative transporter ATP-binding protein YbhF [Bacteroidota bacterium]|jgi:ABC-2 type transport system ATP-binding protein
MVRVDSVSKSYKKVQALNSVSFEVPKGELFGLIGPDGAGKSTLFRILTTLLYPDQGNATVAGFDTVKDYRQIRQLVGYMPGRFSLYHDMTVEENLNFFATIFGTTIRGNFSLIKDIYVLLEPFRKRRAGKLSGGMKQKLALCCALIHKPQVLFLDEPTTGVDPVSRKEFWENLRKLRNQGITVVVSTPYMDEASLCDRVGLIQDGEIFSIDTPEGIRNTFSKPLWRVEGTALYSLLKALRNYDQTWSVFAFGDCVHLATRDSSVAEMEIAAYLSSHGLPGMTISRIAPTIEDAFMEFSTRKLHG